MIYKYLDFITEGYESEKSPIYWNSQLNEIIDKEWLDFSSSKFSGNIFFIKFKINDGGKYPFYSVLVENKLGKDVYLMEDNISEKFIEKFKKDFWRNATKYASEFKKFKPKCIGDWTQIEMTNKFNL